MPKAAKNPALDPPECRCLTHYVLEKSKKVTKKATKLQTDRKKWWASLSTEEKHDLQAAAAIFVSAAEWEKPGVAAKTRARKFWNTRSGRRVTSGGFRSDIGISVRSRWEANIARYLNYLKKQKKISRWMYEPRRFQFDDIKRGTRSYLPDFCVTFLDGTYEWWEVKGYWTSKAKTAVKRFRARYPEETLIILDGPKYKEITKEFKDKIPEWEE